MNRLNKMRIKLWVAVGCLLIVGVLAVGYVAKAGYMFSWGNVENKVADKLVSQVEESTPEPEVNLGAGGHFLGQNYMDVNGDVTYHLVGDFIDASTTILSVPDPFWTVTSTAGDKVISDTVNGFGYTGATSTVELLRLNINVGATTTYNIGCGTAPTPYATTSISYSILDTGVITTSTTGIIENNLSSTYNRGIGGGSIAKVMLTPDQPYLICKIFNYDRYAGTVDAFTGAANVFAGKYLVRISRTR